MVCTVPGAGLAKGRNTQEENNYWISRSTHTCHGFASFILVGPQNNSLFSDEEIIIVNVECPNHDSNASLCLTSNVFKHQAQNMGMDASIVVGRGKAGGQVHIQ